MFFQLIPDQSAAPPTGGATQPAPAGSTLRGLRLSLAHGRFGAIVALGFAQTVGMWLVGYVAHLPGVHFPQWLTFGLLASGLFLGGFLAGFATRCRAVGIGVGLLSAALNTIVIGGAIARETTFAWVPPFFAVSAFVGMIGSIAGARLGARQMKRTVACGGSACAHGTSSLYWPAVLAWVTAASTLLLVTSGGLVTSNQAGLAVPDWPQSFGYNMWLFPLSKMTGSGPIYFEHAHRLKGTLVGIATLALAGLVWATDRRRSVHWLAAVAVALVVVQGVMGALRVVLAHTGDGVPVSTLQNETAQSIAFLLAHAVTGQVFLGLLVALAAVLLPSWQSAVPVVTTKATRQRVITGTLLVMLLIQLMLGALQRHLGGEVGGPAIYLILHIIFGVIVAGWAGVAAASSLDFPGTRVLRAGKAVGHTVILQLALGVLALIGIAMGMQDGVPHPANVIFTTAHQVIGAVLLAAAVWLWLWTRRVLVQP